LEKHEESPNSKSDKDSHTLVERTPIHFEETPEAATIALDVAGYSPDDIEVRLDNFVVSIDGKRVNKLGDTFVIHRRFRVDKTTVIEDEVRASLSDGILEVVVPKKAKKGARSIPISTQSVIARTADTDSNKKSGDEPTDVEHSKNEEKSTEDKVDSNDSSVEVETVDDEKDETKVEKAQPVTEEESWEDVAEKEL
jgi:HSP20 family molecular chaperone IbpA